MKFKFKKGDRVGIYQHTDGYGDDVYKTGQCFLSGKDKEIPFKIIDTRKRWFCSEREYKITGFADFWCRESLMRLEE